MGVRLVTPMDAIRSELNKAHEELTEEVLSALETAGEHAVDYAKRFHTYTDRTGNLTDSIGYSVEKDEKGASLEIHADADYAEYVERKGYDVISGGCLVAEAEISDCID